MRTLTIGRKIINTATHQAHRVRVSIENARLKQAAPTTKAEMLALEGKHWAGKAITGRSDGWLSSPLFTRRINSLISGDPEIYWLLHIKQKYFADKPCQHAATLGCGDGALERNALSIDLAHKIDGYDISAGAIEAARQTIPKEQLEHVNFIEADLNEFALPIKLYDVIFAPSSLHHIDKLEHIASTTKTALAHGGIFVMNEYVGPSRFQWTDAQLEAANEVFASLPPEKRKGVKRIYRPPIDETRRSSPFEAIRSAEILPVFENLADYVEKVELGGGLLQPLLENIYHNFDEDKENDRELLRSLWRREKELMAEGVIYNNFLFAVMKPKT